MRSPAETVQGQVDAYNQRDIAKFASYFSEDIQFFNLLNHELRFEGKQTLIEKFQVLFDSSPNLKLVITERMVFGDYVIDHEVITGASTAPEGINIVSINYVKDGLIHKLWFTR